jgi:hypothetical protein
VKPPPRGGSPAASARGADSLVAAAYRDATLPLFSPVENHRWRWALLPWVKLSGTTAPLPRSLQRVVADLHGAFMASSTSPCSRICRAFCA